MEFVFLTLGYAPDLAGGAYRYTTEVAERLASRGHTVQAIFPNPGNRFPEREHRNGVELVRFPNGQSWFLRNWWQENAAARRRLRERLDHGQAATLPVLCHAYLSGALPADRGDFVYIFHGPWGEEHLYAVASPNARRGFGWRHRATAAVLQRLERRALRRTRRILTPSHFSAEQLPHWHGRGLAPIHVISAGFDEARFRPPPDRPALRLRLGLGADDVLFLTVRRLDPRMGLPLLLESFANVARDFPRGRLWLAGEGPQAGELQRLIAGHDLAPRVRLLGRVPEAELAPLYGAADCTLVPSLALEGFGLATVESLACGTPVLGSRAGATPEVLAPLADGLLFETGSRDGLTAKLRAVLAGALVLPDRAACAEYARTSFTWGRAVEAVEQCGRDFSRKAARA